MLPQSPLSKIETDPPTCLTDKGENRNWVGRLKKKLYSIPWKRSVWPPARVGKEILYLCALLRDVGSEQTLTTHVYEDNRACITMIPCTANPPDTLKFAINFSGSSTMPATEAVNLIPLLRTHLMVADALIKILPDPVLKLYRDVMLDHTGYRGY